MHEELVIEVLHSDPATANRLAALLRGLGHEAHTIDKPSVSGEPDVLFAELRQVSQAQAMCNARVVVGIAPGPGAADQLLCHEITDWITAPFEPAAVANAVLRVLLLRRKSVGDATRAQRLSEQYDQLQQEHDLFAGRVSHDLASILRSIDGFASAFERRCGPGLDVQARHYLSRIQQNADRGTRIIRDLSRYQQLSSCSVRRVAVDLDRLLQRARASAMAGRDESSIAWRIRCPLPSIPGDPFLLEHALTELLTNAVKFSAAGDAPVIDVYAERLGGEVELNVVDNGIGFDPAEMHRLFQPFARLHPQRPEAGVGMGLAIVRRIAEKHSGSVRCAGRPAGGAHFTIVLPDTLAGAGQPPRPGQGRRLRILLIDDEPAVLLSVKAMLERAGHQVTAATEGDKGLIAFENGLRHAAFDLVITDWGMPRVGGDRVAEAVKKICPSMPVWVLTGQAPAGSDEFSKVDKVITKPLRLAQVRALLAGLQTVPAP